jgi:hypothetical protein
MSQFVSVVKLSVGTVELAKRLRYGTWEIWSLSEHLQEEPGRRWEDFGQWFDINWYYSNVYLTRCNVTRFIYLETAVHVSGGTITHYQERKQLYLQHLVFVTPLLLPATIAADSSNGVRNNRCYKYSCLRSWWWVLISPETCRAVSRQNKLCNVASCWMYIGIYLRCTDP